MNPDKATPHNSVLIRREAAENDEKLILPGNNGRKILAIELMPRFGEKLLTHPVWSPPHVLPTGLGGIEVSTFSEFSGQDRHRHQQGTEIYTVLKGVMEIFVDDEGPFVLNQGDEIVILPGSTHEVVEQTHPTGTAGAFDLLVRVHSIDSQGARDKHVQIERGGEWYCWQDLTKEQRSAAYRRQGQRE